MPPVLKRRVRRAGRRGEVPGLQPLPSRQVGSGQAGGCSPAPCRCPPACSLRPGLPLLGPGVTQVLLTPESFLRTNWAAPLPSLGRTERVPPWGACLPLPSSVTKRHLPRFLRDGAAPDSLINRVQRLPPPGASLLINVTGRGLRVSQAHGSAPGPVVSLRPLGNQRGRGLLGSACRGHVSPDWGWTDSQRRLPTPSSQTSPPLPSPGEETECEQKVHIGRGE